MNRTTVRTHEAAVALIVTGTVPADASLVTDEHGNTCVRFADGRIAEPFLGWAFTDGKLPQHGERPVAFMPDEGDEVYGDAPDPGTEPNPVVAQRPEGFSFNMYRVQTIQYRPGTEAR